MRGAALALCIALLPALTASSGDASPRLQVEGRLIPGAVLIGSTEPGTTLEVGGRPVMVGSDGRFVIGLSRRSSSELVIRANFPDGGSIGFRYPVGEREYLVTVVEGVPQNTLTPSAEETRRIIAEQVVIDAARVRRDDRSDFAHGFIWPVRGRVSGTYGTARRYNTEDRLRIHWGLDVAMPVGTPVVAPADGVITLAESDLFYSGGTLFLDHGHGMISSFLHLSRLLVAVGDEVHQGQLIGEIGATGRATGPHLDWRIRLRGTWLDPATLLAPDDNASVAENGG